MKLFQKKDKKQTEQEKVDARRKEVLATGRKFKYPLQWTRYRVVVDTILISFVVFGIITFAGWLALYHFNTSNDMFYRITKVLPVAVANVDGENVRFSDYLMLYRSSILSLERQTGKLDGQDSLDSLYSQYRRSALSEAEEFAYAEKLARELNITVSKDEIDTEFKRHLAIGDTSRSEAGFLKIIETNFGLDKKEYERMLYLFLVKAKVEVAIDENANRLTEQIEDSLARNNNDYLAVATELGEAVQYEETGGMVSNQNIDGGRAIEAFKLQANENSGRFISTNGDGYYFVKLLSKTETEVNFVSLKVSFSEFDSRFSAIKDKQKISEYINTEK